MESARNKNYSFKPVAGILTGALVLVAGTTILTSSIFAQDNLSDSSSQVAITAIPPRLGEDNSLLLKPGEKKQVTIRVINSSTEPLTVRSTAQDFIIEEDGSTPVPIDVEEADNRWSLASWLTITPGSQQIGSQQTKGINVLIEVPEDALPGGHYAMITHQPTNGPISDDETTPENQQSSGINQRVGTLLYVIVDGPINEKAFIRDFTIPRFLEFGPVPFSYTVENESDVHIRPQMGVQIKNIFGKKVADIQPETKNIFPFTNRSFEGQWDRVWGFGRYKAEVIMTYGMQNQLVVASTVFWLLPVKLIIAIVVVILLLILGIMSVRRHIIHKRQDQNQKINELETKLRQLESEKLKKFEE